ncbi:Ig-like domain-containing protein [Listeria monocytogenes]|uniref:Ig-like domain-containing protein n=1 Tax=Listeria monocytogenes TaxID=1639 RepID=UPI001358550E|nr:Ig-like domain-containing protein [Listeria monocytogenes]
MNSTQLTNISASDLPLFGNLMLSRGSGSPGVLKKVSLSNLPKTQIVDLDYNQINDVSISNLSALKELHLNNNQISDVSPLVGLPNNAYINVGSQRVTLPAKKWAFPLNMTNTVKGITGNILTPSSISNSGQYINGKVSWTDLANTNQDVSYSWMDNQVSRSNVVFSGTATTRITPASVKILVDSDGNSQTTGDQTLFAEATSNLASLEGMYNYAKVQLNGTNYGLINIASDSNGDYVILVSRVGSLKKEDANGTAVGTDVSYTPTYTVTGTGNTAQLEVSYGVTVDAPPTGYVYIYGKGTAQEARSTASTSITIPLTDTNGNGTPQWQEDYTVKQYKKAGALHPSIPGGDLEVIGVPGDAVGGDIVTIPPDTITGSDGREYIVDPSIDIDPNTPGVQITLTEDEQDIPYLDVLLSESESTSASLSESESSSLSESESKHVRIDLLK